MTSSGQADPFGRLIDATNGFDMPEINSTTWRELDRPELALPWVRRLIQASDAPRLIERWMEEKWAKNPDHKPGRPRGLTVEALLVCQFLCKRGSRALNHAEIGRFICRSLSAGERLTLGISEIAPDPTHSSDKSRALVDEEAMAGRVGRLMADICDVINPEP